MIIEEWMISNPKVSIIILSFLITLAMTLVTKKFTDQIRMKEIKKLQKACQAKIKEFKGDIEKQGEIQKEMMGYSMELMKHSFKPMLFTFLPLIFLFWWIRGIYTEILSGWIWWYIGSGILSSIILRKVLNVV